MPGLRQQGSTLGIVAIAVGGRGDGGQAYTTTHRSTGAATEASALLIGEESRSHHFGAVISGSGKKLKHAYRLANSAARDVKIVGLANLKPCCGEVRIGPTRLQPGEGTEIEVTLSVRQEFGEIVHGTRVITEPPQPAGLVLLTMAKAYPPIRIEEVSPASGMALLSSDKPKRVEFRLFAYGSPTEAPVDLDRLELRSATKVDWLGPKEPAASDGDVTATMRRFSAEFDPTGPPGGLLWSYR
jgi:hypothetical protein